MLSVHWCGVCTCKGVKTNPIPVYLMCIANTILVSLLTSDVAVFTSAPAPNKLCTTS